MYLAAHPDDENTRLISYLTGCEKADVAYLSLTRGSGGQNLIGTEKGSLLSLLRTEELLAARRIDNGHQYFTSAVDFGYSKTSDESFRLWGKEAILEDVVYIIRNFRPHIVINRFPPNNYAGHGHHQASAELSMEAFEACADSASFPGQLDSLAPWQVSTLYFNASSWWDKTLPERARNDQLIREVNIGGYNAQLGYSYNELAAMARSQHKSQGFGSEAVMGDQFEYLEYIKGSMPGKDLLDSSLLDETDLKWLALSDEVDALIRDFDLSHPEQSVASLVELRRKVVNLVKTEGCFKAKLNFLDEIISDCLGLSVQVRAKKAEYSNTEVIDAEIQAINRSTLDVKLLEVRSGRDVFSWNRTLESNVIFKDTFSLSAWGRGKTSNPYWLNTGYENRYNYDRSYSLHPGSQVNFPYVGVIIDVVGDTMLLNIPVDHYWTDRVKGGLHCNVRILPEFTVSFDQSIYFPKDSLIEGNLIIRSVDGRTADGSLHLMADSALKLVSESEVHLADGIRSTSLPFSIRLSTLDLADANFNLSFIQGEDTFGLRLYEVEYDHIRPQMALLPCRAKVVPVDFSQLPGRIAYIPGPDNEMLEYLKAAGCDIEEISEDALLSGQLGKYQVLLFGIRSININPRLNQYSDQVLKFMKNGGNVVVLYQTSRDINPLKIAPYDFEISRKRITDENATTKVLNPDHPIVNKPYKLHPSDFEHWNQERGLYFADSRSEKYQVIFSWSDPDETEESGGLIVTPYGKGSFIYTGISFFRHIPAGVPGSYRLLMNILSYKPER